MSSLQPADPGATSRRCTFCGEVVDSTHRGCLGLFKDVMNGPPPDSPLDEMPPEAERWASDESRLLDDRYVLVDEVGRGGMGTVWKAWEKELTRWVAIKFLNASDEEDFVRFEREAKLAARLSHPNIAAVYGVGEAPSRQPGQKTVRYLSMQFIDGRPMAPQPDLPLRGWVDIFIRVARAVEAAHRGGVIHRDLKPQNIMLTRDLWPYVMDFGLAKTLRTGSSISISGVVTGTPAFMPPEQARAQHREVDERSDLYSLGATMYAVLVGREPYGGQTAMDVLLQVATAPPPPPRKARPDLPEDLAAVIEKAMSRDKAARHASAGELAEDLQRVLARLDGTAVPPPPPARSRWILAAALAALLAAGVAFALVSATRSPVPLPPPPQPPIQLPEDPLKDFTSRLGRLLDERRFKDAAAHVEEHGERLGEKRAGHLEHVQDVCRRFLDAEVVSFCAVRLKEALERPLGELRPSELEKALPDPAQMLAHPAFEWIRPSLGTIEKALSREAPPAELFEPARAATRFPGPAGSACFAAAELAAFRLVQRAVEEEARQALGKRRAQVAECRERAAALKAQWDSFAGSLEEPFRDLPALKVHAQEIADALAFPADPPYLAALEIGREQDTPNPQQSLDRVIADLRTLDRKKEPLTLESEQKLLYSLAVATAIRRLLEPRPADEIAEELKDLAPRLKALGLAADDLDRFGPNVRAVLDRLLR
jgi:serine/threonine protein kinase